MGWAAALVMVVVGGCGDDARPAAPGEQVPQKIVASTSPRRLLHDADRRTLTDALRTGVRATDLEERRVAVLALARLHDLAAVPLLKQALRDPDPQVRRNAGLGLGALEDEAPPDAEQALVGALAAESDPPTRAALLWDLGRVGREGAVPALRDGLAAEQPEVRAGACRGIGALGLRTQPVPSPLLRRVAERTVDDTAVEVRVACAYALTRVRPPAPPPPPPTPVAPGQPPATEPPPPPAEDVANRDAIIADLRRALADPDADVRGFAVRALGKYPTSPIEPLAERTSDADWRVAVQAFRALGARSSVAEDRAYAQALRRTVDGSLGGDNAMEGTTVHVLLTALEGAAPLAQGANVAPVAVEALDRLDGAPPPGDRARGWGLAHCAAAKVVDLSRRWPTKLLRCGHGLVSESQRNAMVAETIGLIEGADAPRLALLERLARRGDARVKAAVAGAAAKIADPGGPRLTASLVNDQDAAVAGSACDAIAENVARFQPPIPTTPPPPEPVAIVRPASGDPLPVPPAPVPPQPPVPLNQLRDNLRRALERMLAEDEVEGIQSVMSAIEALRFEALAPSLEPLARHSNRAVRDKANKVLRALGATPPAQGAIPPPENVVPADRFTSTAPIHVLLRTSRGEVELELLPAEAPSTVTRFTELLERQYFRGLKFHRVVPAFVVQGGDPRGDGYGGPGWTQRCEDNRISYVRGTVGMALAGRDTGGSQFFITHNAQPHLDGRYTAFGRVVRGMEVVDTILVDDTILEARVLR